MTPMKLEKGQKSLQSILICWLIKFHNSSDTLQQNYTFKKRFYGFLSDAHSTEELQNNLRFKPRSVPRPSKRMPAILERLVRFLWLVEFMPYFYIIALWERSNFFLFIFKINLFINYLFFYSSIRRREVGVFLDNYFSGHHIFLSLQYLLQSVQLSHYDTYYDMTLITRRSNN